MRTASAAGGSAGVREPAGAQEVHERVVAGREPVADLGLERLELRVHAVAAEAPAQVDEVGRVGRREARIEHDRPQARGNANRAWSSVRAVSRRSLPACEGGDWQLFCSSSSRAFSRSSPRLRCGCGPSCSTPTPTCGRSVRCSISPRFATRSREPSSTSCTTTSTSPRS